MKNNFLQIMEKLEPLAIFLVIKAPHVKEEAMYYYNQPNLPSLVLYDLCHTMKYKINGRISLL